MKPYEEAHETGTILFEQFTKPGGLENADLGIKIANDGRVWICINGQAFIRFSPDKRKRRKNETTT